MIEDMMPTPCPSCDGITDYVNMTSDPLGEYEMVCTICADDRSGYEEDMQEWEYERRMPDYQKHRR